MLYRCGGDTKYKKLYEQEVSSYNNLQSQYNSLKSSYNNLNNKYSNSKLTYGYKRYNGTDGTYASTSLVTVDYTNSSFNFVTSVTVIFNALNINQTQSRNVQLLVNGGWVNASSVGNIQTYIAGGEDQNHQYTWLNTTGAKVTGVRALGVCNETIYGGCTITMMGYSN